MYLVLRFLLPLLMVYSSTNEVRDDDRTKWRKRYTRGKYLHEDEAIGTSG